MPAPLVTTLREKISEQDFSPLRLTARDKRDVEALRTVITRLAGSAHSITKTPPEILIFCRRELDAGLSAPEIARRLNKWGFRGPLGGKFYPNGVLGPWRRDLLALITSPVLDAARAAQAPLRAVLDADDDPTAPQIKSRDRTVLRQALAVLEAL